MTPKPKKIRALAPEVTFFSILGVFMKQALARSTLLSACYGTWHDFLSRKKILRPPPDFVSNLTHSFRRLSFWIREWPVLPLQSRHERARLSASDCDQHIGAFREFFAQELWTRLGEIHANFPHGYQHAYANMYSLIACNFVGILQAPQPKISRHLAYLRKAGLVATRREGKWMHYRLEEITDPAAASVLKATLQSLERDESMQQNLARLERACCGLDSLVQLSGNQMRRASAIQRYRKLMSK